MLTPQALSSALKFRHCKERLRGNQDDLRQSLPQTGRIHLHIIQKNSRRLELSISKNTPHGRWGQGPGSVDPRFPAGLPFPVPEILEFVAFGDSGKIFQQFSRNFPGTFLQNSRKDPETATAFSSFLNYRPMILVLFILLALLQKLVGDFFLILGREIWREIWREFCGIFSDPRNKGSKISGKISEHFS